MIRTRPSKRTSRRSPFAGLRALPRIGQEPVEPDWDRYFDDGGIDILNFFQSTPLPDTHPAKRHLGYGQNDATVMGCNIGRDSVELVLNHYDVWRLASVLSDRADAWHLLRNAFPVTLRFVGVTDMEIHRVVEHGVYQKIRAAQKRMPACLYDVCEMACVHYETDRQHYVLKIHGRGTPYTRRGREGPHGGSWQDTYAICLVATRLEVQEGYRAGWIKAFGGRHLNILDAFEGVWPVPCWAVSDFHGWLESVDFVRN